MSSGFLGKSRAGYKGDKQRIKVGSQGSMEPLLCPLSGFSPLLSQQHRHSPGRSQGQSQYMACSGQDITPGRRAKEKETLTFQHLGRQQRDPASSPQADQQARVRRHNTWALVFILLQTCWGTSHLSGLSLPVCQVKIIPPALLTQERYWEKKIRGDTKAPWKTERATWWVFRRWNSPVWGPGYVWSQWKERLTTGNCDQGMTHVPVQTNSTSWGGRSERPEQGSFREESRVYFLVAFPNLFHVKCQLVAQSCKV